jgi:hypothetical protein
MGDVRPLINEDDKGDCDPSTVLKQVPSDLNSFAVMVKKKKTECGSSCPSLKGEPTAENFAKLYISGGVNTIWGGLSSLIVGDPGDYFVSDSMNYDIINIILSHYNAGWSFGPKGQIM